MSSRRSNAIKSIAKHAKPKPIPRTQALPSPRPPIPHPPNTNVRQQTRSRYVEPQQRASQPCQGSLASQQQQRPSAPTTASLRGNRAQNPQNSQTAITDRLPLAPHPPSKTTGPSPATSTTSEVEIPKGLQQYFNETEEHRALLRLGPNPSWYQRILNRWLRSLLAFYGRFERNKGYLPWYDWCKVYVGLGVVTLLWPIVTVMGSLHALKKQYKNLF